MYRVAAAAHPGTAGQDTAQDTGEQQELAVRCTELQQLLTLVQQDRTQHKIQVSSRSWHKCTKLQYEREHSSRDRCI